MKLCSKCIQRIKVAVSQPQLLKVFNGCDSCLDIKKKSFAIIDVIKQTLAQGK